MTSNLDRRQLFAALAGLAAAGAAATKVAQAATPAKTVAPAWTSPAVSSSWVMSYEQLPVRTFPNGGTQRRVCAGTLPTGEFVEVHETMLPAGEMPHPAHKHPNSEFLFIQTGDLQYLDGDTQTPIKVGPGAVVFSASNILHGLKNVGTTPATYIVVSVGKQLPAE